MRGLDDFRRFVADEQASSGYSAWLRDNCGAKNGGTPSKPTAGSEGGRWFAYRDAILAGGSPTAPAMVTSGGKALVDAGMIAVHAIEDSRTVVTVDHGNVLEALIV